MMGSIVAMSMQNVFNVTKFIGCQRVEYNKGNFHFDQQLKFQHHRFPSSEFDSILVIQMHNSSRQSLIL